MPRWATSTLSYKNKAADAGAHSCGRQQKASPGRCPATRRREPVTPRSTTMSWSQIWYVWTTKEAGGKGLDTGFLRDHLHAATAVGRMASAAKAVALGYGIEPDVGRSGRLGGWAISGIPREAWEGHANRSAQIEAAVGPDASYRSRSVAARVTRDRKSHESVE